jgi:hypothetical protein
MVQIGLISIVDTELPAPESGAGLPAHRRNCLTRGYDLSNDPADNLEQLEPKDAAQRGSQADKDVDRV